MPFCSGVERGRFGAAHSVLSGRSSHRGAGALSSPGRLGVLATPSSPSCPAGESFYGWGGNTPGLWRYVPRAGSGTLQVTIGNKTAALPNTRVEISAV